MNQISLLEYHKTQLSRKKKTEPEKEVRDYVFSDPDSLYTDKKPKKDIEESILYEEESDIDSIIISCLDSEKEELLDKLEAYKQSIEKIKTFKTQIEEKISKGLKKIKFKIKPHNDIYILEIKYVNKDTDIFDYTNKNKDIIDVINKSDLFFNKASITITDQGTMGNVICAKSKGKLLLIEKQMFQIEENNIEIFDKPRLIENISGKFSSTIGILRNVPVTKYTENLNKRIYCKELWMNVKKSRLAEGSLSLADHPDDEGSVLSITGVWHNFRLTEKIGYADLYLVGDLGKLLMEVVRAGGKIGTYGR